MFKKGFALIELLVVIAIIGILVLTAFVSVNYVREKGKTRAGEHFAAQAEHEAGKLLVGSWDFDETSGTMVGDGSGNNNNGVLTNMVPSWSSDTYSGTGRSLLFDGADDYVEVPYSLSLAPDTALSFGAWFKVSDTSQEDQTIISKTENGGYSLIFKTTSLSCPSNTLCAFINVGGTYYTVSTDMPIKAGEWYNIFAAYDGEALRLFLDGKEVATNDSPSGNITYVSSNALCIGAEPTAAVCNGGSYFNGLIDEVRVYAKGLTATEAGILYVEGLRAHELAKK